MIGPQVEIPCKTAAAFLPCFPIILHVLDGKNTYSHDHSNPPLLRGWLHAVMTLNYLNCYEGLTLSCSGVCPCSKGRSLCLFLSVFECSLNMCVSSLLTLKKDMVGWVVLKQLTLTDRSLWRLLTNGSAAETLTICSSLTCSSTHGYKIPTHFPFCKGEGTYTPGALSAPHCFHLFFNQIN